VENDANCAAFGEYEVGCARDFNPVLLIIVGTGIGGLVFARNDRDSFFAKFFGVYFRNLGGALADFFLVGAHADGVGRHKQLGEIIKEFKEQGFSKVFKGFRKNFAKSWTKDSDTKLIGMFAGVASLLGPVLRYVKDDNIGNILGHVIEAFNNFGYTIWGNLNERQRKKKEEELATAKTKTAPQGQLIDFNQRLQMLNQAGQAKAA